MNQRRQFYDWNQTQFEDRLLNIYLRSKDPKYGTAAGNETSFAMLPRTIEGVRKEAFAIIRITRKDDCIIQAVMTLPIEEEINVRDWLNIVNSITYK